ncbi:nucleotide exchange factor GrpE [Abyssalbus ytuae]|uniref:Protein GrpE n=1 Tax=Abyssalbus ytuae TaxID=2926907 RepID=A0A9E6ZM40_9FLAO|nr:nucleotide exchange factor GrpE [Abyssalbus ytuae]UOB18317.1 nucleotide exchange factor GrpE [Abyssalbus ytuae]
MSKKKKDIKENDVITEENVNNEVNEVDETVEETGETSVEDQLQNELKKEKDKFLRLFAEFENYKKRTTKERIELFKTASQDVMLAMLPVLDDFDRALVQISASEDKEMLKGVELISDKFKNTLKNKGLEQIEVKQGDVFDAEIHEAITQVPAPSEELKGKIIDIVEKGYKLGDKIIRHPKVVVGQ